VDHPVRIVAWLESPEKQQTPITGTCLLGRSAGSTIVLADDKVSRRHAMVHAQGQNEFWIIDLGSANGTYLNGRRVIQPCRLENNDRVRVGASTFVFHKPHCPRGAGAPHATVTDQTAHDICSQDCWLLVADIEGSSQLLARLAPEESSLVTGLWLNQCKEIIDQHRGAINKFLGDGFLAYWVDGQGVALSVARALEALRDLQEGGSLRFRIVLHYGKVYVSGMGSMGEDSLMGSDVHFVFRMEKLAKALASSRLLSATAHTALQNHLPAADRGCHPVPGFEGAFRFFQF